MPRKSLALVKRDPEAEIEAIRADVVALEVRDLEIVHAMDRFADEDLAPLTELSDKALKERGWTRRQLKVAMAANLPRAEVPYALQAAHERTLARVRRHSEDSSGAKINVSNATFNILAPAPRAKDIDVVVVEKDPKK